MFKILKALYEFFRRMEKQRRSLCGHCGGIRCCGACRFEDARPERARSGKKQAVTSGQGGHTDAGGAGKAKTLFSALRSSRRLRQHRRDGSPDKHVPE
jgi:hypothetical protein